MAGGAAGAGRGVTPSAASRGDGRGGGPQPGPPPRRFRRAGAAVQPLGSILPPWPAFVCALTFIPVLLVLCVRVDGGGGAASAVRGVRAAGRRSGRAGRRWPPARGWRRSSSSLLSWGMDSGRMWFVSRARRSRTIPIRTTWSRCRRSGRRWSPRRRARGYVAFIAASWVGMAVPGRESGDDPRIGGSRGGGRSRGLRRGDGGPSAEGRCGRKRETGAPWGAPVLDPGIGRFDADRGRVRSPASRRGA